MKKSILLLQLLFAGLTQAQSFQVPVVKQPFFRVIEWKGIGALALSRDPSFNQRQVDLIMVSDQGKSAWQQVYNPMSQEPYFIAEDGGKYAYFLENLELKENKVYMHQLSSAGNIKVMNLNFISSFKQLGSFDLSKMYLTDIITTSKALVWTFTYRDKERYTTIAVSMTHHNFTPYAYIVSELPASSTKVEDQVSWYLAGENGDNIVYAARLHAGKSAGWLVKEFDPKGKQVSSVELEQKGTNFIAHSRVGFGRRGSALLKRSEPNEKGTLLVANGNYYVGGVELTGTQARLVTYKLNNKVWEKMCESNCTNYNTKKPIEVGAFNMSEGIGWYVNSAKSEGHFHPYNSSTGIVSGEIEQSTGNPSRLMTAEQKGKFAVEFDSKWMYFDPNSLPSKESITFEYIAK
jgi:hypothetical protein